MDRYRREVLGSLGGALLGGLSGCVLGGQSDEERPRASPTAATSETRRTTSDARTPTTGSDDVTPLQSPGSPAKLQLTATVASQADGDPARIEATLENADDRPIEVRFGPTLLYTDNSEEYLEWAEEIVLEPDTYIGPWDDPFETDDGCWRYPADGEILTQSIAEVYRLEPGDTYSEGYDVLTIGEDGPCLPEGTYRFQDLGYSAGDDSVDLLFTVNVTIDSQQVVSADAQVDTGQDVGS